MLYEEIIEEEIEAVSECLESGDVETANAIAEAYSDALFGDD